MMPTKWILLLLEDGIFNPESTCYAIKLAKRIGCSVSVLMLVDHIAGKSGKDTDDPDVLRQTLDMITAAGIHARGHFGYGDKASEFLKHLALNPSLVTIVWGGREGFVTGQKKKKTDHWFTKVKSTIQCPVIRPAIKEKYKKQLKTKNSSFFQNNLKQGGVD